MSAPIPALVLAGSRPGPDPLLTGSGVSTKALLPVAGLPMLVHVVRALRASRQVGPIHILAQNSADLAAEPLLAGIPDLHFADSGPGISASDLAQLFKPFFTAKKPGGNGLGLWVTYQIVQQLGGRIVAKKEGEQMHFIVEIPFEAAS